MIRIFSFIVLLVSCYALSACPETDAVTTSSNVSCSGVNDGQIRVFSTFGSQALPYTFSINGIDFFADSVFNNLAPGDYTVSVRNNLACTIALPNVITITEPSPLSVNAVGVDVVCEEDGIVYAEVAGGTSPYFYSWSNGVDVVEIDTLRNIPAGTYQVTVKDRNDCVQVSSVSITEPISLEVSILADETTIEFGDSIELDLDISRPTSNYTYQWFPESVLSCNNCINPVVKTTVDVQIRVFITEEGTGCSATDSITILVDGKPSLYVPNAFSPNGDGRNDFFTFYGVGITEGRLEVYDSRGFKLYEGDHTSPGWDGSFSSKLALEGIYYFLVEVGFANGAREIKKGQLALIR